MHFRLIDANSVGFAQHHAQEQRQVAGQDVQAVLGTLAHIRRHIQSDPDTINLVLWDGRAQWRYDLHPGYKGSRMRTPEQRQARQDYERQRPTIQRALRSMPVWQLTAPTAEADDLGYGLSIQLAQQGHEVTLHTADTDWLQTVRPRVRWANARKAGHVVSAEGFENLCPYAFPQQVAQVKALSGDDTDDIEGVPDVAHKRASALLARFGGLDGVLQAAADPLRFASEPKYYQALTHPEVRALVERNRNLVDLSRGPALHGDAVLAWPGTFEPLELYELFVDLQFEENLTAWRYWERALDFEISEQANDAVALALEQLSQSWPTEPGLTSRLAAGVEPVLELPEMA